jgi:hypothetical protein
VVSLRSPILKAAEDAQGNAYKAPPAAGTITYGVGSGSTQMELTLSLQAAAAEAADRLARLEIGVPVRLRHGRKWVTFRNLQGLPRSLPLAASMTGGPLGGTVTLRRFEAPPQAGGAYVVEVTAQMDSEVGRESVRAYLEAADGSLAALGLSARSTSADGTVEMVGRGRFSGPVGPAAVRVSWFVREGDGEASFRFEGVPLR